MDVNDTVKEVLRNKELEFIKEDYAKIVASDPRSRLSENDVKSAISVYKGKITPAPESYYKNLEIIKITGTEPVEYFVDFDLWIDNKQSDLTATFHLTEESKGVYQATLDDLHTL